MWYINCGIWAVSFLTLVIGISMVISLRSGLDQSGDLVSKASRSDNVSSDKSQLSDSPLVLLTKKYVSRFEPKKAPPRVVKPKPKAPSKPKVPTKAPPKPKVPPKPKAPPAPPKKVVPPPKFLVDMVVDVGEFNKLVWLKLPGKTESQLYVLGETIENYIFIDIVDEKVEFERDGEIFKLDFPRVSHLPVPANTTKAKPAVKSKSSSSSRRSLKREPKKRVPPK